jgi:hypothetical protein
MMHLIAGVFPLNAIADLIFITVGSNASGMSSILTTMPGVVAAADVDSWVTAIATRTNAITHCVAIRIVNVLTLALIAILLVTLCSVATSKAYRSPVALTCFF